MRKYWVYKDSRILGPFDKDAFSGLPGVDSSTLVSASETAASGEEGGWLPAGEMSDLAGLVLGRNPSWSSAEFPSTYGLLDKLQIEVAGLAGDDDFPGAAEGLFQDAALKENFADLLNPREPLSETQLRQSNDRVLELTTQLELLYRRVSELEASQTDLLHRLAEKETLLRSQPSPPVSAPAAAPPPPPIPLPGAKVAQAVLPPAPPLAEEISGVVAPAVELPPSRPADITIDVQALAVPPAPPESEGAVLPEFPAVAASAQELPDIQLLGAASPIPTVPAETAPAQPSASEEHPLEAAPPPVAPPSPAPHEGRAYPKPKNFRAVPTVRSFRVVGSGGPEPVPTPPAAAEASAPPPPVAPAPLPVLSPAPSVPVVAAAAVPAAPVPILEPIPAAAPPTASSEALPPPLIFGGAIPQDVSAPLSAVPPAASAQTPGEAPQDLVAASTPAAPPATMSYSWAAQPAQTAPPSSEAPAPTPSTQEVLARLAKPAPAKTAVPPAEVPRASRNNKSFVIIGSILVLLLGGIGAFLLRQPKELKQMASLDDGRERLGAQPAEDQARIPLVKPRIPAAPAAPAPASSPAPSPAPAPASSTAEAPPERPSQPPPAVQARLDGAVSLVKEFPLDGGRGTVAQWLQYSYNASPDAGQEAWNASATGENEYLVEYRFVPTAKGGSEVHYLFAADMSMGLVFGKNLEAQRMLAGSAPRTGEAKPKVRAQPKAKAKAAPRPAARKAAKRAAKQAAAAEESAKEVPLMPLPGESELKPPAEDDGAFATDTVNSGL